MFHVFIGCTRVRRIRTMDLMCLNPYFHGTASRIGAPSCFGRSLPYSPVTRIVSGCIASSIRRPST